MAYNELTQIATLTVPLQDPTVAGAVEKLIDALEDHDDVQKVYSNLDIDESALAQVEA